MQMMIILSLSLPYLIRPWRWRQNVPPEAGIHPHYYTVSQSEQLLPWKSQNLYVWATSSNLQQVSKIYASQSGSCGVMAFSFACCVVHAGFLLGLFFNLEHGGDMFLRNVGWLLTDYKASCPQKTEAILFYRMKYFIQHCIPIYEYKTYFLRFY
jgi:hypothetical protein